MNTHSIMTLVLPDVRAAVMNCRHIHAASFYNRPVVWW